MTKQVGEWLPVIDVGGARTNLIFRHPINELFDVQVQNPLEGQVLSWDANNGYFEPRGSYGGGVSSLYALLEVSINPNTLPNNAVLTYDLANNVWIASPFDVPKIVELSDVDNIPLLNGHILIWESTISKWKPGFLNAVASINGKTGQVNLVTNDIPESPGRLFLTTANFNDLLAQSSINRLSDVSTSGSLNNQVLTFNGSEWVPRSIGSIFSLRLEDLSNVFAPTPANGQVLTWSTAGNRWQLSSPIAFSSTNDIPEGSNNLYYSASRVNDLLQNTKANILQDIHYASPSVGQVLAWNGTAWVNSIAGAGNTDQLPEGSSNLYFTNQRVANFLVNTSITYFSDVDYPNTPQGGQVLSWNASANRWEPATILTSLTNTDSVPEGAVNKYFLNSRVDTRLNQVSINLLQDVDTVTTPPLSGQALVWDATTNKWQPDDTTGSNVPLSFVQEGDANGLINYLGTKGNSATFITPTGLFYPWLVTTTVSSNLTGDSPSNAIDRNNSTIIHTAGVEDSWWKLDLGKNKLFRPTKYTLRTRSDTNDNNPEAWKLQGSNDDVNWVDISIESTSLTIASWFVSQDINAVESYRYFRIFQNGVNTSNELFLVFAGIELYGLLTITGVTATIETTDNLIEGNINKYYSNARVNSHLNSQSISILGDVNVSGTPISGAALVWVSNQWRASTKSLESLRLTDLIDVSVVSTPSNNDVLAYDTNTNNWKAKTFVQGGLTSINDLPDVDTVTVTPTVNNVLLWNGLSWVAGNAPQTILSVNGLIGAVSLNADNINETGSRVYFTRNRLLTELQTTSIKELSDVSDTQPSTGQVLVWSNNQWTPQSVGGGGSGGLLADTISTSGNVNGNTWYASTGNIIATLPIGISGMVIAFTLLSGNLDIRAASGNTIGLPTGDDNSLILDVVGQSVTLTFNNKWYVTGGVIRG
jgi:hypothetical protein